MRGDSEKVGLQKRELESFQTDARGRLGASLQRLRAERGWGQEEAAWQAQVGMRAYQRLEAGRSVNPTLNTLVRLAMAFGVDVRDLLAPATPPTPRRPGRPRRPGANESETPTTPES